MPDIFGRELHDYEHLGMLASRGLLDDAQRAWAADSGYPPHDFSALNASRLLQSRFEANAQAVGFLNNNLQAIQAMIEEILYTEDRLMEMVPVVTDVPEGAETYAYRVVDRVGLGRFIDFDGSSAPSANVGVRLVPYAIEYAGIVPEWTLEDLRRSMMTGVALDTETMEAATRGARDHIESVAFAGDPSRGFVGLTNLPTTGDGAVTYDARASGPAISAIDTDDLVEFLQTYVTQVVTSTAEVFGRTIQGELCIYLPIAQAAKVAQQRLLDVAMSVWEYFARNNSWTSYTGRQPVLKWLAELAGAGESASDRMIIAVRDRRVMELAMPIAPRVITTIDKGYSVCAPMEYKISGLNVKRPTSIIYADRI